MWVHDIETRHFLAVNAAAEKAFGYSRENLLGMAVQDLMLASWDPVFAEDPLTTSQVISNGERSKVRTKKGETIDVELAFHDDIFDGRKARIVSAIDVTERLKHEEAIRSLNASLDQRIRERTAELEAANKELEAFSYSVSHDLRSPLRAIDGFTRMFAEDYGDRVDAEGRRILNVVRKSAQNMGKLIDDLLSFSRLGRKQIESSSIDMNSLAISVSNELAATSATKPVHVNVSRMPAANGDGSLLKQVFVNLFSNAVKYSATKDSIEIEVGAKVEGSENIYFVRDRGVGFDMQYSNKLFGVFQRLHSPEEFEGTGVGLAIVQRIVHRHGGRVWAEGAVDRGATFYFSLPRYDRTGGPV